VITFNGQPVDTQDVTIATLLSSMNIETRGVAVALNGEIVRRGEWSERSVVSGDRVEVVSAVAGGA
jgi:sulfur carrier protein